jgi:hypothetical protein
MVCNTLSTLVEPDWIPSRVLNVPGRTTKPARRSQVKMNERMQSNRGTSSSFMFMYDDRTILGVPEDPPVTDLFGYRPSDFSRSKSRFGLRVTEGGVYGRAPTVGELVPLMFVVEIELALVDPWRGCGPTFVAADIRYGCLGVDVCRADESTL